MVNSPLIFFEWVGCNHQSYFCPIGFLQENDFRILASLIWRAWMSNIKKPQDVLRITTPSLLPVVHKKIWFLFFSIWIDPLANPSGKKIHPLNDINSRYPSQSISPSPNHPFDAKKRAGPPGVIGTAEIIRLNVEAVATSPSRSTRLAI